MFYWEMYLIKDKEKYLESSDDELWDFSQKDKQIHFHW